MASQTIKNATPTPIRLTNVELGRAMGRACDAWQGRKQRRSPIVRIGAFILGLSLSVLSIGLFTGRIGLGLTISAAHIDAFAEVRSPSTGLTHGYGYCSHLGFGSGNGSDVPPE